MTLMINNRDFVSLWGETIENTFQVTHRPMSNHSPDRVITGINVPFIKIVKPKVSNGIGLMIIPGGGYSRIVYDKEGEELTATFTKQGYTLFILIYRLPFYPHIEGSDVCLADVQQAMRMIKNSHPDLHTFGVMGFSAGGHVAASLGVKYDQKIVNKPNNHLDFITAKPDFMVLMYPVISMSDEFCHKGSREQLLGTSPSSNDIFLYSLENHVSVQTPPTLLIHAVDDKSVPYENSLIFFKSLQKSLIPSEIHLFEKGGHGFSLRETDNLPVENWPIIVDKWIKDKKKMPS